MGNQFCRPVQDTVVRDLVKVPACLQYHGCQRAMTLVLLGALTLAGKEGSAVPGTHCAAPNVPAPNVVQQRITINP